MALTPEQRRRYVSNKGSRCPHCSSSDLLLGSDYVAATLSHTPVTCGSCNAHWVEVRGPRSNLLRIIDEEEM